MLAVHALHLGPLDNNTYLIVHEPTRETAVVDVGFDPEAVIEAMNTLGFDAMALGNHEFDYGVGNVVRLVRQAKFPVLAANASGIREVKPYVVLAPPRVPCRIAVIGLITTETPFITGPGATKGVRFSDPAEATRALMKEVQADLYIVVSHIGRDADLRLAADVPGIALIAGGHSHTPVVERVNGTLVLQTHAKSLSLARGDLTLEEMIVYLKRAKRFTRVPVSTAEPWHVWLRYPELAKHVDFITVHLLPYWEGVPVEHAVDYALARYDELVDGKGNNIDVSKVDVSMNGIELQDREFFAAIRERREPNASLAQCLPAMRTLDRLERSLKEA